MQKDAVQRGTPIPLFFKGSSGLSVEAYIQHPDFPAEAQLVPLTEITTAVDHIKVYVGTYTPNELGWYVVTFRASSSGTTIGSDATRFYSYAEGQTAAEPVGEALLQELSVKVGSSASITYRGIAGLTVQAKVVHESELLSPNSGTDLTFTAQPAPTGYKPLYLATFSPTREGKFYVYIKASEAGGEALAVVSAFRTLPYSRATGSIKSTATSTVV